MRLISKSKRKHEWNQKTCIFQSVGPRHFKRSYPRVCPCLFKQREMNSKNYILWRFVEMRCISQSKGKHEWNQITCNGIKQTHVDDYCVCISSLNKKRTNGFKTDILWRFVNMRFFQNIARVKHNSNTCILQKVGPRHLKRNYPHVCPRSLKQTENGFNTYILRRFVNMICISQSKGNHEWSQTACIVQKVGPRYFKRSYFLVCRYALEKEHEFTTRHIMTIRQHEM